MPRLIPDGPDIPAELIHKQEAGEMVFFCGAGISISTGLPCFGRLVDGIYESLNIVKDSNEEKLIELKKFDEALGRLEERVHGNAMRSAVVPLFSSTPTPDSLRLHRALLRVSRNPSGMHLVTTNYDDNFAHANGPDNLNFDAWPTLPELENWDSVVHLHGRIRASADGPVASGLVLTDTDFGNAYLTGRQAAKFVSELMGRYTVVFVGYSMQDVVVRYLTRALAKRRLAGRTYSLVGYANEKQRKERELVWSETGIYPIFYHSGNQHELLVRTVEEWAKLATDPHQYRIQLAVSGLKRVPDKGSHEADPERVVWALSDPAATWQVFSRIQRTPVPGAYAAAWLDEFADRGLMSGTVQPKHHERGAAAPVITVAAAQQMLQTDSVANAVTRWIEIHAHLPEVFQWVINHGRNIGFELRRRLWDRLTSSEDDLPDIPPRLVRLWTLLLAEPPEDAEFLLRLNRILDNLSQDYTEATDEILLQLLRPRLGVFPGPPPYRILSTEASSPEEIALLTCGHTDVILGCRDEQHRFNVLLEIEPSRFEDFTRRHSVILAEYLKTAFVLLQRSDRADARFIHFELSDASASDGSGKGEIVGVTTESKPTEKQRRRALSDVVGTWAVLLDWVRASYRALPEDGRERHELLRYWATSNEKMLWRLALEAIEQDISADFDLAHLILHRNTQEVLWDPDCHREVLSVLRQVGTRASAETQVELLDAVQDRAESNTSSPDSDGAILAAAGARLAALLEGGVTLNPAAAETLATFERRRDAAHRRRSEPTPLALTGRIQEVAARLRTERVEIASFREFAQRRPAAAVLALQELSHSGGWPAKMWKVALEVVLAKLKDKQSVHHRTARLAEILLATPEDLFQVLDYEIAQLVEVLAERWPRTDDSGFWRLWTRGWEHRSQQSSILSRVDALTKAMNTTAGTYATAAIKRIGATTDASRSLTSEQISIFSQISSDVSGSAGIVMLVFGLNWLYEVAPDWTTRHIIPRMRWRGSEPSDERYEEVCALWGVVSFVAFRRPITDDLVRALGSDLWTAVQRHKQLDNAEKLIRFFVYASVSPKRGLIDKATCRETARIVIADNPRQVGLALRNVLDEYDQPSEQVWREYVHPWLDGFWPRESTFNTADSSWALVQVIMETGDAFPEAVDWANDYLMALDDQQISDVRYDKNTWKAHPRATVALLHRIVPEVGIDPWARTSLMDMLTTLREVDATITEDAKFVELERRAAR